MPDRAEIEAVANVLEGATSMFPNPSHAARYYAEKAIEALDRVRDARRDDEKQWTCDACEDTGIDRRESIPCGCDARPPQGEDHEARVIKREKAIAAAGNALDDVTGIGANMAISEVDEAAMKVVLAYLDALQGEDHEATRRAITDATRALNAELPGEAWLALKAAMRHLETDETDDT